MTEKSKFYQILLSYLLISVGMMLTITFGFVPLLNYFETYANPLYSLFFWGVFGGCCIIYGKFRLIDRIKKKSNLLFSFILWGILVIMLNFTTVNLLLTIILVSVIAALTGIQVIVGANYISSNIHINRRGFYAGIYLGIGWGAVALSAYISFIDLHFNLYLLGISAILVGVISTYLIQKEKVSLKWDQIITIPRNYNVKKNGMVFWMSSLVFSTFLGIIVFLLGTTFAIDASMESFYLENRAHYIEVAEFFNLGLVNFDFIAIGALNIVLSPLLGKAMDKYGRKPIYLITNLMIPGCLIFFTFWQSFVFLAASLVIYAMICASYVVIESTVWSDLAPEGKNGQFNGYGWSSMGLGGAIGFFAGYMITLPALVELIDILVIMTIILLSEISMIPFVSMKDSLPPAEEMDWPKEVLHLYVIKDGGIIMTDFAFSTEETFDADLLAGGMTGVTHILKEMIAGKGTKLKIIDHEDKKLLFEYGKGFSTVLISHKDLKILRNKLITLTTNIENVFWETIEVWQGDLDIFKPIKTMVKHIFTEN